MAITSTVIKIDTFKAPNTITVHFVICHPEKYGNHLLPTVMTRLRQLIFRDFPNISFFSPPAEIIFHYPLA